MNNDVNAIAIIPARGGSKGVIGKNLRLVAGKPLVAWTIEAARKSRYIKQVVVSTDSDSIAAISRRYGAEVVERPADISGDAASSESALLHAVSVLEGRDECFEEVVFLQCTSPFTTAEDIDACIQRLRDEKADVAFTAKVFYYFVWKEQEDGRCVGINHDMSVRPRRQDREPQYEENGAVYVMKKDGFLRAKHRFFGKTVMSVMPESRSYEIDTEADLEFADWAMARKFKTEGKRNFPTRVSAIVFDFDGVMTDDTVQVSEDGKESVRCSREDGQGVARALKWGIPLLVLSTETNHVVSARCAKLHIPVMQNAGLTTKVDVLRDWAEKNKVDLSDTVFVGNDLNDLDCMRATGFAIAPANATRDAKAIADHVLLKAGGNGAVRECLEFVAEKTGKEL